MEAPSIRSKDLPAPIAQACPSQGAGHCNKVRSAGTTSQRESRGRGGLEQGKQRGEERGGSGGTSVARGVLRTSLGPGQLDYSSRWVVAINKAI